MKYLFGLFNIACLTATMFLLVETLYSYIDAEFTEPSIGGNYLSEESYMQNSSESKKYLKKDMAVPLLSHYAIIHKRDIFRTSKDDVEQKATDTITEKEVASLEKTDLKLKLWGTVTGNGESKKRIEPNKSINDAVNNSGQPEYAVIETEKNKKQALYKKGDEIEGAVIKNILRFSVILSRNGKDERLEMAEESSSDKAARAAPAGKTSKSTSAGNADDKIEVAIKRSLIDDSMKDINSLMSQVRARPHFTGGNADGILLYGIKQSSMFKDMGIQNGDIIMGVDGTEIKSVDDAISLYDRLKNSSDVKMQIRRRGQVKEILYHVE